MLTNGCISWAGKSKLECTNKIRVIICTQINFPYYSPSLINSMNYMVISLGQFKAENGENCTKISLYRNMHKSNNVKILKHVEGWKVNQIHYQKN